MCNHTQTAHLHDPDDSVLPGEEDRKVMGFSIDQLMEEYQDNLEALADMVELIPQMVPRDQSFANSLSQNFYQNRSLSPKQWSWVHTLRGRVVEAEPIYGSFDPIRVMFRLASNGLKKPRIRLITGADEYLTLTFRVNEKEEQKKIEIHSGGWAHHGHRRFVGWIRDDAIVPYRQDRLTETMKTTLQDLALDPMGTMKAMAAKIGACGFCFKPLVREESKRRGYGKTCAKHYGLPWGKDQ